MFNKEFADILNTYKNGLSISVFSTYKSQLNQAIDLLKQVRNYLSNQIYEINTSDEFENEYCYNMQTDIIKIKQQLQNLEQIASIIEFKENQIPKETSTQQSSQITLLDKSYVKPVSVWLSSNEICPCCGIKLIPKRIYYYRNINGTYDKEEILWYKCTQCRKFFVPDSLLKKFDLDNTNIKILTEFYNKLTLHDTVYVLSDINHCSSQEHKIEDINATLAIVNKEGEIEQINVEISHCLTCERYVMLKSTYDSIRGVPVCAIFDERRESQVCENNENTFYFDKESKIRRYGYNVNVIDDFPTEQRQTILSIIILENIMTKQEVVSYLDKQINNGERREGSKKDWSNAVSKWKVDRSFVKNIDLDKQRKRIDVDKIILKYTKTR